jgi:hypothetical protein
MAPDMESITELGQPDGQITCGIDFSVESLAQKYFASRIPQIKLTNIAVSSPA